MHAKLQQAFAYHQNGQLAQAEALYQDILHAQPGHGDALRLLGHLAYQTNRPLRAVEVLSKAIAIDPGFAQLYSSLGLALQALQRFEEALANYTKAIALDPNFIEAYYNRGNSLRDLRQFDAALIDYDRTIALKPDLAEAHCNRALTLSDLQRAREALAGFDTAIALKPNLAEAHNNRGNALSDLGRLDEALASYDRAIAIKPGYVDAHKNRGNALKVLKRLPEAVASYDKAIALDPNHEFLLGMLLHTKMLICDWQGFDDSLRNYEAAVRAAKKATLPFPALALSDSPELHKQAAAIFAATRFPEKAPPVTLEKAAPHEKIRVGYYSADFRNHAVSYLTAELFEVHDRNKFEIYGFSFGDDTNDTMRRRVSSAFDRFIDAGKMQDRDVVELSRKLGIDIAVDLGGYTQELRLGVFALRCAPIQINYLGYPGTMGVDYFDYVIADKTVIPVEHQTHFAEKIVYLPHSFQPNDSKRTISDKVFARRNLGLPESGFVFCSFNNTYKILPTTFSAWMRILGVVKDSVLWLTESNPTAELNLRREAERRGVSADRLVFAKRMASYEEHLARYRAADLFIDTLPYNAHTTASDALWAGLPVLTCVGKSFASRVAASLLKAIDMPELITGTAAEYEAKAIELASTPSLLAAIKSKLERNRLSTPLFDAKLFARHIESAYTEMHTRYRAGRSPENIDVGADL